MKERPILFNTEMVQAILSGKKTQTRRAVKITYESVNQNDGVIEQCIKGGVDCRTMCEQPSVAENFCPYGAVGDILWVRETTREWHESDYDNCGCSDHCDCASKPLTEYCYRADGYEIDDEVREMYGIKWTPAIHMKAERCRLHLKITSVRVERLNKITNKDAKAEGVGLYHEGSVSGYYYYRSKKLSDGTLSKLVKTAIHSFASLWVSIYGEGSWNKNPWVWVVEFEVVDHE